LAQRGAVRTTLEIDAPNLGANKPGKKQKSPDPFSKLGANQSSQQSWRVMLLAVGETEMTFPRFGNSEASWEKQNSGTMSSPWHPGKTTSGCKSHFHFSHCEKSVVLEETGHVGMTSSPLAKNKTPCSFQGILLLSGNRASCSKR